MAKFFLNYNLINYKKLTLIFATKKSYEICLPIHLTLTLILKFEYALPLYISTPIVIAKLYLYPSPFTSSEMLLSMTNLDETDGSLHAFE